MVSVPQLISSAPILLYVEDDDAAATLFTIVLKELKPETTLFIFRNCQDTLKFLHRRGPHEAAPRPHLLILDIHLPDGSGFHILENIRGHQHLAALPAVFFSTSLLQSHQKRAVELGALAFFHKPTNLIEFEQTVERIHTFVH